MAWTWISESMLLPTLWCGQSVVILVHLWQAQWTMPCVNCRRSCACIGASLPAPRRYCRCRSCRTVLLLGPVIVTAGSPSACPGMSEAAVVKLLSVCYKSVVIICRRQRVHLAMGAPCAVRTIKLRSCLCHVYVRVHTTRPVLLASLLYLHDNLIRAAAVGACWGRLQVGLTFFLWLFQDRLYLSIALDGRLLLWYFFTAIFLSHGKTTTPYLNLVRLRINIEHGNIITNFRTGLPFSLDNGSRE
mmetsp:Transcript_59410/g.109914  ORF Transcript_59410/g.109914 Transcript_59410/m.109914 type:complete len:245 (-) Transcript_59410:791-1525(-)